MRATTYILRPKQIFQLPTGFGMRSVLVTVAVGLALNLPSTVIGQLAELPVHPGDLIELRILYEPDMSGEYPVSRLGVAVFPRLGAIKVSEHTPGTLHALLAQEYRPYLRNPSLEIIVRRPLRIGGAVHDAGFFHVDPTVTVLEALAMAGGPTPQGQGARDQL